MDSGGTSYITAEIECRVCGCRLDLPVRGVHQVAGDTAWFVLLDNQEASAHLLRCQEEHRKLGYE